MREAWGVPLTFAAAIGAVLAYGAWASNLTGLYWAGVLIFLFATAGAIRVFNP